ncbi:S9 family peptidase [Flexithrix dorotheae]|uniref:S9 family peptidase n=1 Tax=Flexithrix dorotheae TaxID=70993 RepID=UPI000380F79E|nr:oligopeptidase B [Flexithrix dorotheae]
MTIQPPKAKKINRELTIHGHTRIDPYFWLNQREDPEVLAYIDAENDYTNQVTAHFKEFQDSLFEEIKGRIKEKTESLPYKLGNYFYYHRFDEGLEYPIHCRKKENLEAEEEILLDVNKLAEGEPYFSATGLRISENDNILAFSTDNVGRRIYTLRFKDLTTGEFLPDVIENVTGNATWADDNKTIFYTVQDQETLRSYRVYKHILGTDSKQDQLIYEEEDETFNLSVGKTKSKKIITINSHASLTSEIRFLPADNPNGEFKIVHPREREIEYHVDHFEDKFYILTNYEAQNFRLMSCEMNKSTKENWQEVIPHRKDVLLEDIDIFKEFLALEERFEGLTRIRIINWKTQEDHYLDFGEPTYTAGIDYNPDFDTKTLRYGYNSLTTPSSVFDYDMEKRTKELKKQQEVIGDFNPDNYQSERITATAADGVKVPISLVYRKGVTRNGNNPFYMTAYGSYGHSYDPYFSSVRLSLLDRGFVFAIAHIRGGQEMGRWWYDDGKMLKKKNTFTDFIACAEHIIKENFTTSEKLVVSGGSAGGLLMGAVVNMRPDLFKIVVADVPFVDVVSTMLDDTIPLTTGEYDEWGNPNEKKYYDYMLSYSPYDQVEAKQYPNMLITSGLHDSQVQYWEPTKWTAKLRDLKTDQNLLLLKTNTDAGHGGASGRFERLKEVAFEYAFIIDLLGIKKAL